MLSTSSSSSSTYNHPADSGNACKKDNQFDKELPNKASWNGYNLFTTPPLTVFSKSDKGIHFNKLLQFKVSTADQEQQTAISQDNTNPFIKFLELKDEEEVDKAISNLKSPTGNTLDITPPEDENEPFFDFNSTSICYKSEFTPEQIELYPFAKVIEDLSIRINSEISLNIDRHFHTTEIPVNLVPHEDPIGCEFNGLPNSDGNQQDEMAYSCDYLFTNVRSVNDETLQKDHLCLYLAAKGLGNTSAEHVICADPEITDDLYGFIRSLNRKEPAALRLCKIDNKPGAGYAINQNTEYTMNIKSEPYGLQINCCNSEKPQQLLFQHPPISHENPKEVIEEFNNSNVSKPIKFKVLHGYEIAPTRVAKRPSLLSKSNSELEPVIKREILIGRLAVIPRKEDLPQFHEKKSTEYTLGSKTNELSM